MRALFPETPLQENVFLSQKFGCRVFLKREDLSPVRSYTIRGAALQHKVPYSTTIAHAYATSLALTCIDSPSVERLQDLHQEQVA